jgi:dTDP-4-dehydrorhamnose 3,5-epimerase
MDFINTSITGVFRVRHVPSYDSRGSFCRLFCSREFAAVSNGFVSNQVNLSKTARKGTFRGFHYQCAPAHEYKLISCIQGKVHDIALDIRKGSPTFLEVFSCELNPESPYSLLLPPGVAHGFQTLEDNSSLIYNHSGFYTPEHQAGIRFDDPRLTVMLPLPVTEISERDATHPLLNDKFQGIEI